MSTGKIETNKFNDLFLSQFLFLCPFNLFLKMYKHVTFLSSF